MFSARRVYLLIVLLLALVMVGAFLARLLMDQSHPPAVAATPATATGPATIPAAATAPAPPAPSYLHLIQAAYPDYPDTQPSDSPVDLPEAARIKLNCPVYICTFRHDLWITSPDAPPTVEVLKHIDQDQIHLIPDRIAYVHWMVDHRGRYAPALICPASSGYQIITAAGSKPLGLHRDFQWNRAMSPKGWQNRLIVPSSHGVSIIDLEPKISENYHALAPDSLAGPIPLVQMSRDKRGLLAWIPADANFPTGSHPSRFVEDKWIDLDSAGFSDQVIHLVPMGDGSVLQIARNPDGSALLSLIQLDKAEIDTAKIIDLVAGLSDDDPDKRDAAFEQLTLYDGPGAWPLLEKLQANQTPEVKTRIQQLLDARLTPKLGGMQTVSNRIEVLARLRDTGVVLKFPDGILVPQDQEAPRLINPGFLVIRPLQPIHQLPAILAQELKPITRLDAYDVEWLLTDDHGSRRYIPPRQLSRLVGNNDLDFAYLIGIDSRGRWAFAKSPEGSAPTLILDPTIPDPVAHIAVWQIDMGTSVGWDKDNWPVVTVKNGDHYALQESGWMILKPEDKISSAPSTPDTNPSTPPPIGVDADGSRYFDGHDSLTVVNASGHSTTWPLPDDCRGSGNVWLVPVGDRLFLFNAPGQAVAIRHSPATQPFKRQTIFTKGIPDSQNIMRIWLDPAGRIDVAYDQRRLAVIFPTGQIPKLIADQIPPANLIGDEEDQQN